MSDNKKPEYLNEGYTPRKDVNVPLKKGYTPDKNSLGKTPPPQGGSGVKNPPKDESKK